MTIEDSSQGQWEPGGCLLVPIARRRRRIKKEKNAIERNLVLQIWLRSRRSGMNLGVEGWAIYGWGCGGLDGEDEQKHKNHPGSRSEDSNEGRAHGLNGVMHIRYELIPVWSWFCFCSSASRMIAPFIPVCLTVLAEKFNFEASINGFTKRHNNSAVPLPTT